jgi:hypothetical protein
MNPDQAELPKAVSVPDDVLWQEVEGQVVLLNIRSGEFHQLDEVGSRMWLLMAESRRLDTVTERLLAIYAVDDRALSRDLAEFISRLVDRGLLAASDH